jgi:dUTP pyrophosphatase
LIDAPYRGELKVLLINTDPDVAYRVNRGDRIAQLVVQRVELVEWVEVGELAGSDRDVFGFGSTGR